MSAWTPSPRFSSDLELDDIPQLVVFNKSDLLSLDERVALGSLPDSIVVSALTGDGTEAVVERVGAFVKTPETVSYPSSS